MFNSIQPENYQAQLAEKQQAMAHLFADFAIPTMAVFPSAPTHYRMRAEFAVWHQDEDCYFIMRDPETKQRIRVDQYLVASTLINRAMIALRDYLLNDECLRQRLFQVDFLSSQSDELLITLIYHKPLTEQWQQAALTLQNALQTLANKVNIIGRARKQKCVLATDYVTEVLTVDGQQYRYQQVENSFTQPNAGVNQHMLSWARAHSPDKTCDLVELYCGNGNFSIALADKYRRVLGTEISKTSVKSAQTNIALNGKSNIDILRMSSEEFSQAMNGERSFKRLADFDLSSYGYDTVLVDPPRAGLDDQSLELVSRFQQIIYISCNPETLQANLTTLTKTHKIDHFALFDQFPYTSHIESGVILSRL